MIRPPKPGAPGAALDPAALARQAWLQTSELRDLWQKREAFVAWFVGTGAWKHGFTLGFRDPIIEALLDALVQWIGDAQVLAKPPRFIDFWIPRRRAVLDAQALACIRRNRRAKQ